MDPMTMASMGTSVFKMLEDSGNQERQALLDAIGIRYSPWLGDSTAGKSGGGNGASVGDLAMGLSSVMSADAQKGKINAEQNALDQLAGNRFKLLNGNGADIFSTVNGGRVV